MPEAAPRVLAGIVLAGGRGRRLGLADKAFLDLGGKPLIAHVLARLAPQMASMAISANGDPARFADFALPVLADAQCDFPGPLAGMARGLAWAEKLQPPAEFLLTVPVDCPFLPRDLVGKLQAALDQGRRRVALAASGGRLHPTIGFFAVGLRADLEACLALPDARKVEDWARRHDPVLVDFPARPVDPFFNINTEADLAAAERILAAGDAGRSA